MLFYTVFFFLQDVNVKAQFISKVRKYCDICINNVTNSARQLSPISRYHKTKMVNPAGTGSVFAYY